MKHNLNTSCFCNGDTIPQAKTSKEWKLAFKELRPAWCYYDNKPMFGEKYGKLYNWYAVNDPRGLAPEGWHIPSNDEWNSVREYISNNNNDFKNPTDNILNTQLGGYRNPEGLFCCNSNFEAWWSSTPAIHDLIFVRYVGHHFSQVDIGEDYKETGCVIRCVADSGAMPDDATAFQVGKQYWMKENLNVFTFRNGDTIYNAVSTEEWMDACNNRIPAWCYYLNDSCNGNSYGKIYNWFAVIDQRGIAPIGYHVPNNIEWTVLEKYMDDVNWNLGSNNQYNFINCSGGWRRNTDGEFAGIGDFASMWGNNLYDTIKICYRDLSCRTDKLYTYYYPKGCGVYVRCVKD